MPIIDAYLSRLGVGDLLEAFVPGNDGRMKLAPARALGVLVRNLVLHREPVYALGEWAAPFDPSVLGLDAGGVALLNDDRVGRALLALFDADRASLLNRMVLGAVAEFSIDCSQLHNDSTSVKLTGVYANATGATRGSKPTVAAKRGHSKDHRPDLLTELREESSQFRALRLDSCLMVPARGRRRCTQGSGLTGGAIGGFAQRDRRSVGALSAA
jgi:hypothetical protein